MLGTIKVPMNMKLISDKLPSSNYDTDKEKKRREDRRKEEAEIKMDLPKIAEEIENEDNFHMESQQRPRKPESRVSNVTPRVESSKQRNPAGGV